MRRGSSTSTWPEIRPETCDSNSGGTRVVLPAPGGASITRLGDSRKEAAIAGSRLSIGRRNWSKLLLLDRWRGFARIVGIAVFNGDVALELLIVLVFHGHAHAHRARLEIQGVVRDGV